MADFEDFGYAGVEGGAPEGEALADALQAVLDTAISETDLFKSQENAQWEAIDTALERGLTGVDMLYLERDDQPTTSVSGLHGSWEAEAAPLPCDMDAWLRAAIPQQPRTSFAMEQFLRRTAQPDRQPSTGSRPSSRPGSGSMARRGGARTPGSPATPNRPGSSSRGLGSPSPDKRLQSPLGRGKSTDNRLREELEIRRGQDAIARSLDAKDEAEKERLMELRKTLKGRDYSYDHKGEIVVMSAGGFVPTLDHAPAYRLAAPSSADDGRTSPQRRANAAKDKKKDRGGSKERKLVSDFREAKATTQPSALETVSPSAGVTLRGGSQSKSGPPRPRAPAGSIGQGTGATMSREEFSRYLSQQELKAARAKRDSAAEAAAAAVRPSGVAPGALEPDASASHPTLFAGLPDSAPATFGGTLRTAAAPGADGKGKAPTKADVNAALVTAADWGAPGGGGGVTNAGGAPLPYTKPTERQRAKEVAQADRMPRNRLAHPNLLGGTAR